MNSWRPSRLLRGPSHSPTNPSSGKTLKYFIMKRTVNQNESVKAEGELSVIVGQFLGRLALDVTVSLICHTNNRARAILEAIADAKLPEKYIQLFLSFFFLLFLLTFYVGGTASFSSVRLLLPFTNWLKPAHSKRATWQFPQPYNTEQYDGSNSIIN